MRMTEIKTNKNQNSFFLKFRRDYRESLKSIGFSPYEHVDSLDLDYLPFYVDKKPVRFLESVKKFYGKLDPLEQLIFKNEILEPGRHGSYWWFYYFKKDDFLKTVNLISVRFIEEFRGDKNDNSAKA